MPAPSQKLLFCYAVIALPLAFAGLPLYIHIPDFYIRQFGLNIGILGVVLLFVRFFDAIQDPYIGYICDKYARKRFTIIALGALLLFAGMAALLFGPQFSFLALGWFAFFMILASTGFSIITINLNMIGGFWQDDKYQRTRISAWREVFTLLGLLIAALLPSVLQYFQSDKIAFQNLFWIFALIMIFGFVMFRYFFNHSHQASSAEADSGRVSLSFLPILIGQNRAFFGVCFLTHLGAAIPAIMVLFFIRDYLGAENLAGFFLLLYFFSGAALMGFWVKLSKNIGKYRAWLVSILLAVATFSGAFFLKSGDIFAYGVVCILSGMALGADLALPPSILADRISAQNKIREATQYYALLAFIPKMAIAFASFIIFVFLDRIGFVAGEESSPQIMSGLILAYALVPCIIKLSAAYFLWQIDKTHND